MRLFIAEKPDLAKAICAGLGGGFSRQDGYMVKGDDYVTWCFGHMLRLFNPEEYDAKYKSWSLDLLPFVFVPPQKKLNPKSAKQTKIIHDLMKKADILVNAGDPDEEGQLLVDELIRFYDIDKPVLRVLINDNNTKIVAKAIANMKPNSEYEHLGFKAEARSIADQTLGFNLTRAFTEKSKQNGGQGVISIGRVQTPILGLVVRRDQENKAHEKAFYYNVIGSFNMQGMVFDAMYQPSINDTVSDSGKLIDKAQAEAIASACKNQLAKVVSAITKEKSEHPPLPYNLLKLQQDASRKFGLKPDQTLKVTQSLREKHKLITYNRSDCQYLSDEQHTDAAAVLGAIVATAGILKAAVLNSDSSIKGRVFNSAKVSAHHAIVPTETAGNLDSLSEQEKNIYLLIARSYVSQFYPNRIFDSTEVVIEVAGYQFKVSAKVDKNLGWSRLYKNDKGNDEVETNEDLTDIDLRNLNEGNNGNCTDTKVEEKETQPPKLYTMTTLLGDLTKVSKYVKNPKLAKILKEKDKDKAGEHGGIGTPATRSSIIETLFQRGYLVEHKKNIISTKLGQNLYDILDDSIRYPDMTAKWHEQQKNINSLDDSYRFVHQVMADAVVPAINRLKATDVKIAEVHACPNCERPMARIKGDNGWFWGCTGYSDETNPCKNTMGDKAGKPIELPKKEKPALSDFECRECNNKLIHRTGKSKKPPKKSYSFFACSAYPKCNKSYEEKNGEPCYE